MRRGIFMAALALAAATAGAQQDPDLLVFPLSGFSIAPLEGAHGDQVYQVLMMFLPASDEFAPNVNVQIQPTPWTLDQYVEVSDQQFLDMGLEVLYRARTETSATWEYAGSMSGRSLHWYTVAVAAPGRYYVVTATATESQWPNLESALLACVESFVLHRD